MSSTNNYNMLNNIIHIHSEQCEKCNKVLEVPIRRKDKDSARGGIFRIAAVHQCLDDKVVKLFYFDDFLVLRQKISVPVADSDLKDEDYFDRTKLPDFKKYAGFKYLHKKIKKELTKLIFATIIGKQIVITGEPTEVKPSCLALSAFSDHRVCFIEEWTTQKSDADILGTTPEFESLYPQSVILDLENKKVKNGTNNSYCEQLIKKLLKSKNKSEFDSILKLEISNLLSFCQEFSCVNTVQEAEDFIQALALEGTDKGLIEIILPLTAQINPNVGIYYRKYLDLIQIDSLDVLEPIYLWIFDNEFDKERRIDFSQKDLPFNFRESNFVSRLNSIAKSRIFGEELFELVTPIHYFVTLFGKENNLTFCFPRMSFTREQFASALRICKMLFEKFESKDIFAIYLADLIREQLNGVFNGDLIKLGDFENYITIKKILAKSHDFFVLERHYIKGKMSIKELRSFTEKLTRLITKEFGTIDPKIIHQKDHFIITESIPGLPIFGTSENVTIDINFRIHFISTNKSKKMDIILEFYSDKIFFQYGIELNSILLMLYQKFLKIIEEAHN